MYSFPILLESQKDSTCISQALPQDKSPQRSSTTIFMPRESMAHRVVQLLWVDWLISAGLSYLQAAGGWPEMALAGMIDSVTQDSDHPG